MSSASPKPAKSEEPTMEDILASIRRIIADDQASGDQQEDEEPADEPEVPQDDGGPNSQAAVDDMFGDDPEPMEEPEEEVIELMAGEYGLVRPSIDVSGPLASSDDVLYCSTPPMSAPTASEMRSRARPHGRAALWQALRRLQLPADDGRRPRAPGDRVGYHPSATKSRLKRPALCRVSSSSGWYHSMW